MGTIAEAIEAGTIIWVHCDARNCHHGQELNLPALARKLGPGHGVMHDDLKAKFKCSKCASKEVSFIHSSVRTRDSRPP